MGGFLASLRHPVVLGHRIWRAWYERTHPDEPWFAPGAVRYLNAHLRSDMRVLEWGSGRSTVWIGRRVGSLLSVEHDPGWHERVREATASSPGVEVRLIEVPEDPAERDAQYWQNPPYVRVIERFPDGSLDLVVVDGLYRQACTAVALPKIARGGMLLIDDTKTLATLSDWGVPRDWPVVYRSRIPVTGTVIWRKP